MDERRVVVKYAGAPPPPPNWWEKIVEAWSKLTTFQRVALVLGSAGGIIGVIGITRREEETE